MIQGLFVFSLKHTPFWAIPLSIISFQFARIFFAKQMKKIAWFFVLLIFISFSCLSLYLWAGGPEKIVELVKFFFSHWQRSL